LLRAVGVEADGAATYRQLALLFERAAVQLDCPDFGMRLATLQKGGGAYGALGGVMRNSRTFGDAVEYVAQHSYAHSLAARVWLRRYPEERAAFVGHDILIDRIATMSQAIEEVLLLGHLEAMEMTGGRARARRVHFRHQPVSPLKTYRRYFGCTVLFGQHEDGIYFTDQDMGAAMVDSDAQAYLRATSRIDSEFAPATPPLRALVRGLVMQYLGMDHCTNARVAADLKLHPRSLHRRLGEEGTSFQRVKDDVRRDAMLYYVQHTGLAFARISERLGFAEQSVMTRRCRLWFGASPTALRARPIVEIGQALYR
jgi:AraC-like DNA-binding protein